LPAAMTRTRVASDADAAAAARRRNFRLLRGGFSASTLGSRITTVAFPLLVLAITGSSADAGWTAFAAIAPSILIYLPAGVLADRLVPRRVMVVSELGRGAAIAAVVAGLAFGRPRIWELALAAAAEQSLRVFSELAERRLTSSLLERDREATGLARSEAWCHLAILFGRPLGGFLFGLGSIVPFAADAMSFGVSILALLRIKIGRDSGLPTGGHCGGPGRSRARPVAQEVGEALGWLRSNPFARVAMPLTAGTTFIGQAIIMIFLAEAHSRHLSPLETGLVLGASGVGGALGSAAAPWLFRHFEYVLLHRQMWLWAAALALLESPILGSSLRMAIAMASLGFTGALGNVAVDTYLVRHSAGEMFARLVSFDRLTSLCALALGPLAGGIITQIYGIQKAILLLFCITIFLAFTAFCEPSMRTDRTKMPAFLALMSFCGPPVRRAWVSTIRAASVRPVARHAPAATAGAAVGLEVTGCDRNTDERGDGVTARTTDAEPALVG
jgi:MFS family permease